MLNYIPLRAAGSAGIGGTGAAAEFWTFNVNTAAASAVCTIWDGPATTGRKVAVIDCSATCSKCYGVRCANGITCVMSGGDADITLGYK